MLIKGTSGDDTLTGTSGADQIYGYMGKDTLEGKGGNDKLVGGRGNDTLIGGAGSDTLIGGAGKDKFLFNTPLGPTNVDRITDFSPAQGDKIQLDSTIFVGLGKGVLPASSFYVGANAHDPSDRIIYNRTTGNLYYDADGNGPGAKVLFAKLTPGLHLSNSDIVVV